LNIQTYKHQWQCEVKKITKQFHALRNNRTGPILITPRQYRRVIITAAAAAILIVMGAVIGVFEYVELQNVRQKEMLHEQQLEIMRDKTASLQDKMDKLDSLDQELRQMVKGAETGDSPKGDGGVADEPKKSPDLSAASFNDLLLTTSRMETRVNARVVSFITLKTVLSDTAGEQVREMQQSHKKYESSNYPSIWPVKGTITSKFGYRGNPIGGGTGFHEGVDIAVDYGTPIRATASGTVTIAGWTGGYGNLVEIDHGGGFVTRYGHNSMLLVVQGQTVKTGDIIALAGSTGNSTGPHCHYEVRVNGTPTDPMLFLP
jgi:murein DD-endopeptidase MepM/ murein hydrolase activator NlpD